MTCEYCDYSEADCVIEFFDGSIGISCNACADMFELGDEVLQLESVVRITDIDKQLIQCLSACRLDIPWGGGAPPVDNLYTAYDQLRKNFEKL